MNGGFNILGRRRAWLKKNAATGAIYAAILILPFCVFFWLIPLWSDLTIGNDYVLFPIPQQLEIQYHLEHGSFPLYAPGFMEGHSSAALTLGQLFHPLSHVASMLPGYWEGNPLILNTLLKLLGLGLTQLMLFLFLRRLKIGPASAFVISFIAVYNLRMLDMFRYGSSLENYTAYILLCASLGLFYLKRTPLKGPLLIAASSYLLSVGGHPQMMYLGFLGAGLIYLIMPFAAAAIDPQSNKVEQKRLRDYYLFGGISILAGVLLAAPYLFQFYFDFVRQNTTRVGNTYAWSLGYGDTFGGIVSSFFKPLNSDAHSAFGGSALLVPVIFVPIAAALRKKIPLGIGAAYLLLLVIFLIALGKVTPLHRLFWEHFPMAQSFRIPGRITLMMPILFALLLAWLARGKVLEVIITGALSIAVLLAFNFWLITLVPGPASYVPARINPPPTWMHDTILWAGIATLILLVANTLTQRWKWLHALFGLLLAIVVVAGTTAVLRYGTWTAPNKAFSTLEQMDQLRKSDIGFKGNPGFGMEAPTVTRQLAESILDPNLASFYRNYEVVADNEAAYLAMATRRDAQTIVVESETPPSNLDDSPSSGTSDRIQLTFNNANMLTFQVDARQHGYLAISLPYLKGWSAFVDGHPQKVVRANGYQQAVLLPQGSHEVTLKFLSKGALVGTIISLLLLGLIGIFVGFAVSRHRFVRVGIWGAAAIVPLGLFLLWYSSLYGGDNLATQYQWTSKQLPQTDNLAFGRRTEAHSQARWQIANLHYSGRAVDGEIDNRFFSTNPRDRQPWWQVDLGAQAQLGKMRIHGDARSIGGPGRPLLVMISDDGQRYKKHMEISTKPQRGNMQQVDLAGVKTRFVRLQPKTRGRLLLKEVVIHPAPTQPATAGEGPS